MNITWQLDPDASCWHALLAVAEGTPLLDAQLLPPMQIDLVTVNKAAVAWCASGTPPQDDRVAAAYSHCQQQLMPAGAEAFAEQLRLRSGPLREQWQARGPGLMRAISRVTEPSFGPAATVYSVEPVVGGHGVALAEARGVLLEAVLANPIETLPEVLRLAWLLAQLDAKQDEGAARLALVPAVLAAGEEVELSRLDEATLEQALAAWRLTEEPISTAATLLAWWRDYRQSLAPWPIAQSDLAERLR